MAKSKRSDAEESDAKWGAESQKQQKIGRGLKREGALIFCHLFFCTTQFFLCVVHIILKPGTSNEFQCGHVEILVELVLVRVHTG